MAVYRARAELRRDCSGSPWRLGGVVVGDAWHPAAAGLDRPSARLVAGGNVRLVDLPAFIAGDDAAAVRLALSEARRIRLPDPDEPDPHPRSWTIEVPDWIESGEAPET